MTSCTMSYVKMLSVTSELYPKRCGMFSVSIIAFPHLQTIKKKKKKKKKKGWR